MLIELGAISLTIAIVYVCIKLLLANNKIEKLKNTIKKSIPDETFNELHEDYIKTVEELKELKTEHAGLLKMYETVKKNPATKPKAKPKSKKK